MSESEPRRPVSVWQATGFTNAEDGTIVTASSVLLPVGFVDKLTNDVDALGREIAQKAYAEGGKLIEYGRTDVDGRQAFYQIVGMPWKTADFEIPGTNIVARLLIPLMGHGPDRGNAPRRVTGRD